MKNFVIIRLAAVALGAAALGLAGAAAAFPNAGTAADVASGQHTMVFVDVSCLSHD